MSLLQIDYQLFNMVNHWGIVFSLLNPVMRFLAEYAQYLFYFGVAVYWFTRTEQNRRMVVEALISACIAMGLSTILGYFFYRDRPFVAHAVLQLIKHPANASFPSDHAIGAFVIATTIWMFRSKDGKLWLVLAALIALSRVWTGVHYPSDVLAGAIIGAAVAAGIHQLFASWGPALNFLQLAIHIYEKWEQKIWAKKDGGNSLNS